MYWVIVFFIFVVTVLYWSIKTYIYGNDDYWSKLGVPMFEGKELGTFWERIKFKNPLHELDNKIYKKFKSLGKNIKFGGIMEFREPIAFLIDLDMIKHVMIKDFDHFTDHRQFGRKNDPSLFDKMLFVMNNPEWKDLRATLSPTFTTGKIKRMFSVFIESSNKMSEYLKNESKKCSDIDMRDVCGRFTMDVIASAAFGVESNNFKDLNSNFYKMGNRIQNQYTSWLGKIRALMLFVIPSLAVLLRISILDMNTFNFFKDVVQKTIKHRDETGEKRNDFLQLLMEARIGDISVDEGEHLEPHENFAQSTVPQQQKAVKLLLTDDLIVAQCILFFVAGFDTTETFLIYAAYELALNPEIQNRLFDEIKDAVEKNGELNYDVVNQLEYLDMVISETLRKYPPAPRTERKCTRDYKVPNTQHEFKKGQVVIVPVWSIHHDEDLYPEPDKFIPERFTKENKNERNPYSYMPFGVGPRNCIAMRFAITEGKTAIAHLVHNFVLKPTTKTTIPMKYSLFSGMKPIDGMWLNVTPRI